MTLKIDISKLETEDLVRLRNVLNDAQLFEDAYTVNREIRDRKDKEAGFEEISRENR